MRLKDKLASRNRTGSINIAPSSLCLHSFAINKPGKQFIDFFILGQSVLMGLRIMHRIAPNFHSSNRVLNLLTPLAQSTLTRNISAVLTPFSFK